MNSSNPIQLIFASMLLMAMPSCSKNDVPAAGGSGINGNVAWLIPSDEIRDGGPGKDGIPSINSAKFISVGEATYLSDNDLVVGFKDGDEIRAYPHIILDWHEIVNDKVNETKVAITYCPLTGSAIGWNRVVDGNETTFGVSGLLYNTNLIPYDRGTDSNWSQMGLKCVNGPLIGTEVETYQVLETTWGTWKEMYPDTKVMSTNTGFSRNYGTYPYGDYRTNNSNLIFQVKPDDNRLPRKDRVLGVIINEEAKVYPIKNFGPGTGVINDEFNGESIVVVGSEGRNFATSFFRKVSNEVVLEFEAVDDDADIVLKDNEGNTWNIFGEAVSGNRVGQRLQPTSSYIGYWMAWGAFYPQPEISDYEE